MSDLQAALMRLGLTRTLAAMYPAEPLPRPARVARKPSAKAGTVPDYRTAAERWAAGETATRTKRRKGALPATVLVTFADGVTYRLTTYLDGQAGLNETAAFARAMRQAPARRKRVRRYEAGEPVGYIQAVVPEVVGQWLRDGAGKWRLVPQLAPIPEVTSVTYAGGDADRVAA